MDKSFTEIAGYEKEKKELQNLQEFLMNIDKYKGLGVRIPRGIVLHGVPGVGKTKLAKGIACNGIRLFEVRAADCCEDNSIDLIQEAFEAAKSSAPAVVLLDELDKIAGTSHRFFMEDNDNVKKFLLQELDKLNENDGVLVVATCNDIRSIGDTLLRSGRFDRILRIEKPNKNERKKILEKYFSKITITKDFKMDSVAEMTAGYTGAEIECIVNESAIRTLEENNTSISFDTIRRVMNKLAFHSSEGEPINDKDEEYRVAVHEAGHVLVAMLTKKNSIYAASLLPQGDNIGFIQLADEEKIQEVSDIEDRIGLSIAGRIAEREIIGSISLGSAVDLEKAITFAKKLIVNHAAYGYDFVAATRDAEISYNLMYDIEKKISEILEKQDERVTAMISSKKNLLQRIAQEMIEKTVLNREDLLKIFEDDKNTL